MALPPRTPGHIPRRQQPLTALCRRCILNRCSDCWGSWLGSLASWISGPGVNPTSPCTAAPSPPGWPPLQVATAPGSEPRWSAHCSSTSAARRTHSRAGETWGDDVAATRAVLMSDPGSPGDLFRTFVPAVARATGRSRAAVTLTLARTLPGMARAAPVATCEVAREAGRRLGLDLATQDTLGHMTAMWNGKGFPRARGDEIPLPARIMHVAGTAVMFWELGGEQAATAQVRRRSGGELDPELAALFLDRATELLHGLDCADPLAMVLDAEPDPVERVGDDRLLDVARTCGDLVDLKSPWLHGHSTAVAQLAGAAAEALKLSEPGRVRVAGHLHDVGRVAIAEPDLEHVAAMDRGRARPGPAAPVPHPASAESGPRTRPGRRAGRGAPRALRRQRLSPWPARRPAVDRRPRAGRRRPVANADRGPTPSGGAGGEGGTSTARVRGTGWTARRRRRSGCTHRER